MQTKFCSKGTLRLQQSREATPGDRIDLRMSGQHEELYALDEKEAKVFHTSSSSEASLQVSKHVNDNQRFDEECFTEKSQHTSVSTLCCIMFQKFMLYKTVTWNDIKFQRSKIVFDAKYGSNIKDQVRHFALVEACYKALPRRARSRQSNEPTVDSPCTYLEFTT